ncbi:rtf2 [Candida oxycetoniae]|uniref:Rtf2 n=1 Tax=Candida oxycetoniae TaxID=497107 RepID=A0AAI9T283_9ASCO|nr:rtf2 [Candida oxycetoniae]KAI3407036.2 rtf2 [Candida oxycetoniae]
MGNEGGTIAKRQDILSLHSGGHRSRPGIESDDAKQVLLHSCAFSGLPLYQNTPTVGDYKGRLYIKEKILQYILDSKLDKLKSKAEFQHLRSLKDLCKVAIKFEVVDDIAHFQCPITKELDDKCVYAYLRPCGCVMAYKFLRELKSTIAKTLKSPSQSSVKLQFQSQAQSQAQSQSQSSSLVPLQSQSSSSVPLSSQLPLQSVTANCPVCNEPFIFDYDLVIINPTNNEEFAEINEKSYKYLRNVLHLTNSKEPLKKKKHRKSSDLESSGGDFVRKRKLDQDGDIEAVKRAKA